MNNPFEAAINMLQLRHDELVMNMQCMENSYAMTHSDFPKWKKVYEDDIASCTVAIRVLRAAGEASLNEIEMAMSFFDVDDTRGSFHVLQAIASALPNKEKS